MAELNLIEGDESTPVFNVLTALSGGMLLAGAVIAPNILRLLSVSLGGSKVDRNLRAIRYAKAKGWLTFQETENGIEVALSESGKLKWQKIELIRPLHQANWDKKWRLVMFDIPVSRKHAAYAFRQSLKQLGFKQLQHSVWIVPYPCQTQIALLRQWYEIKPYVRIMEVLAIDDEQSLKDSFGL